jgi:predicted sulfurtransferase
VTAQFQFEVISSKVPSRGLLRVIYIHGGIITYQRTTLPWLAKARANCQLHLIVSSEVDKGTSIAHLTNPCRSCRVNMHRRSKTQSRVDQYQQAHHETGLSRVELSLSWSLVRQEKQFCGTYVAKKSIPLSFAICTHKTSKSSLDAHGRGT